MAQRKRSAKPATKRAENARPAPDPSNDRRQAPHGEFHLIVGIGASAGGLAAFKTFIAHMPADTGMAFVLVQHLDPQHESMLVELLRPQTSMRIVEAEDGAAVAANCIYVIPRDATLMIEAGVLRVATPAPTRQHRRPIDTFFCALAEDQGERAVAIVLSGVGSDGSLGVRAIKEHGGLTLAQAEVDHEAMRGMPMSAAATGLVDHVVPIEAMPGILVNHQRHLNEVARRADADGAPQGAKENLGQIATLLRARTGHDFRGYKENTLVRRVQRRMHVLQIDNVASYLEHLKVEPSELDLLFRELLIGVTEFFRDPEAFDALSAAVMTKLVADKGDGDQLRIWVPGCATGEEVYSIAIALREAKGWTAELKVVIFGTDIDPEAVATARAAHYSKPPPGLSPERFKRWFAKDGDDYCPNKEIRDLCVFSVHSIIKDPPFSKLDLISCRNVLIYLNADLQHRVMQTFHYALKPGGYLFLGPSESATREANLFAVVDKKHRILKRRDVHASPLNLSPIDMVGAQPEPSTSRPGPATDLIDKRARHLLEPYSPAYFVIDARDDIVRFSGPEAGRYLEPSSGAASLNLFSILRKELRHLVRSAVQQARAERHGVVRESLSVKIDGRSGAATLIVEPIGENQADDRLCVVAFRSIGPAGPATAEAPQPAGAADVQTLAQELRETKAQLQATVNELEIHVEETRSANEEYQSVNEELQSANEELETAKEEMQSVNEELHTTNAELHAKNEALMRTNSDLQNLMESTNIATVFLDRGLRIRNFTQAITEIFPLRESDRGRPLDQIVSKLIDGGLTDDLAKVQRTLSITEREVQIKQGDATLTFLMRTRPYRTVDNRIDGVVITFVDISDRKRLEKMIEHRFEVQTHELEDVNLQLRSQTEQRKVAEVAFETLHRIDMIGQITSGVAHDFNNLLTVVLTNAYLLSRRLRYPDDQRALESIRTAAQHGAKLTSQLLAFSREQRLEPRAVDLNREVNAMSELLAVTLGGTVHLNTKTDPHLWPALVDPTQIEMIILNLAINGRDAMEQGGGTLTIETFNATINDEPARPEDPAPGDYVGLVVTDTGAGIPDDVLPRVFEPFFTTKGPGKGSGLGLSQVFGIAKQSGGGVRLETHVGHGTSVKVFFPRAETPAIDRDQELSPAVQPPTADATILVVDDDKAVLQSVVSMLEFLGYPVVCAEDGKEALRIVTGNPDIDVVLADFAMPGMNGVELATAIRTVRPTLPVILATGYVDIDALKEFDESRILQKPYAKEDLVAMIATVLN